MNPFRRVVARLARNDLLGYRLRYLLLRLAGIKVGRSRISGSCFFGGPMITIGDHTYVNRECLFDATAQITIGDRCSLAMRVTIITSTHTIGYEHRRASLESHGEPVVIGDGCWIGACVTVLPGTVIGSGCVVAAGAVVRGDCAPNGMYAGVPAVRIRELTTAGSPDEEESATPGGTTGPSRRAALAD